MKPLFLFFVLAFSLSWLIWLPLWGPAFGLTGLPVLPFHHAIGGFGPLLASVLLTGIYEGRAGLRLLLQRCWQVRPVVFLGIALFSPFLLLFIALIMNELTGGASWSWAGLLRSGEFPEFSLLKFFGYNLLFFGFGEEVGWRGFALPRMQARWNALSSGLVLTAFWALWHWPLFFYRPGYLGMDAAGIAGWVFSLLTGSILLTWLFNASRGSVLMCAVFHATIDIAFTADVADQQVMGYMGLLITLWGIATMVVFRPKNLARQERVRTPAG